MLTEFEKLSGVRQWFYRQLPRPKAKWQSAHKVKVSGILVLGRLPNPTIAYYFEERLVRTKNIPAKIHSIRDPNFPDIPLDGLFVIVCRYVNGRYLKWIEKNRSKFSGLILFCDDDVPAVISSSGAQLTYKAYAFNLALSRLNRLNRLLSDVWVSTENLQKLLSQQGTKARLLPPFPPKYVRELRVSSDENKVIAFHATAVHKREHVFLKQIIEKVLKEYPQARFEVIASPDLAKIWESSTIDRRQLDIQPLRTWPDYGSFLEGRRYDLFLVPLMPDFLNAARSDTKRIDVARVGAAAIFTDNCIYGRCRMPDEIHLANDPEKWVAAISTLLENAELRKRVALAVTESLEVMRDKAEPNFLKFCEESC